MRLAQLPNHQNRPWSGQQMMTLRNLHYCTSEVDKMNISSLHVREEREGDKLHSMGYLVSEQQITKNF